MAVHDLIDVWYDRRLPDHTGLRVRPLAGPRINSGRYPWQKFPRVKNRRTFARVARG
jgi:hypothetical protein